VDGFPYSCALEVRYRDIDAANHVNNAVLVTYLEIARVRLWQERFGFSGEPSEIPYVVAHLAIDYRSPIRLDDRVEIGLAVTRIGSASFTLEAAGRLAAEAESIQVQIDLATGRPQPLPADVREFLGTLAIPTQPAS
jgi:acyl-CoA thioester hydrolase